MKTEKANPCTFPLLPHENIKGLDPEHPKHRNPEHQNSLRMSVKRQKNSHSQTSTHRTPTPGDVFRRKKDDERLERVADIWDQVRAECLQERHELLSQKVLLQRALISAQDRRAELIRQQEEETKVKKRNEDKKKRRDTLASLQDKCRQSLALDRKSKYLPTRNTDDASSRENQRVEGGKESTEKSLHTSRTLDRRGHRHAFIPVGSPMEEVENENDDMDNSATAKEKKVVRGSSASKHHTPVLQKQKQIAPYDHTGHLTASQIWTNLWSGSLNKLLQADQRFPRDLKETFSAHVRQGIAKFRKPVCRSFTLAEDVPDVHLLMDQSRQHSIRLHHHKTQLMYRSSQTNQNRTNILLFNNPLPFVSEGDDGISRFLPALEDTDSVCTEASYLRWIQPDQAACTKGDNDENVSPKQEKDKQPLSLHSPVNSEVFQDNCHSLTAHRRPRKQAKYHFLTEKEAQTKGDFLAKLNLDKPPKSVVYADFLSQVHRPGDTTRSLTDLKIDSCRQTPSDLSLNKGRHTCSSSVIQVSCPESCWQPLSLHALSEYKKQLIGKGHGEFQQGRPILWGTPASS